MLGSMRATKKNQTVIWIILGLLALGLIGFGGIGAGGGSIRSIGKVGDEKIGVDIYAQSLSRALATLSQQLGRTVTADEAQSFGIQDDIMQSLLTTAALDNELNNLGVSIGDEAVRTQILANRAFQGLDGTFDKESYEFTLERTGLSPSEYDDVLRKETARQILQSAITAGVKSQGTQSRSLLAFDRETRDFIWAELNADTLASPVTEPTDAQLQAQYKKTPDAYTAPLVRKVTYAWLSPEMLTDQVDIDEAEIRESYDLQSDRFNKPEKRSLGRVVFGTLEEATDARNLIDAGTATFNTLLADRDLAPDDVDLGEVERGGIAKDAAEIVFASDSLGVVGPVQSSVGPALFNINAILAEDITPFEDARVEIMAELAGEAARRIVFDYVADIDDLLASNATIEELAQDTEMELGQIELTADTASGIAAYENFRTIANQTNESDFPKVNDLADGGIFALRVDKIVEPTLRPLEDVKTQVVSDWKQGEVMLLLTQKAEQLKQDIDNGASFGSLETHKENLVRRAGYIENTPPQLLTDMFAIMPGQSEIVVGTNSVFIARMLQINEFDAQSGENQAFIGAIQQQLDAQLGDDLLAIFASTLRDKAGVSLNQNAIAQINAQLTTGGGY